MEGIFNLSFSKENDSPDDENILTTSFNHLTLDGMAALFNRTPLLQPQVTGTNTGRYQNTLNYFFFIIDDGQPIGFDLNDHDVKFSQIARFPNTYNEVNQYYSKASAAAGTIRFMQYPVGKDSVTVLAAGMGYKEVGGDGSKDFVWSISPLKTPVVLKKYSDNTPDVVNLWTLSYEYLLRFTGNTVPEIKVNIGGTDYTFIRDPLGDEETNSYFINNSNILARLDNDVAGFTINGAHGVPPSDFVELKTNNSRVRKFEITYTNRRLSSSVDLTGFGIAIGGTTFSWRLEYDKYIVLGPGKKFKITIAICLETGQPAGVVNGNIDYAPTAFYTASLGNVSELRYYNRYNLKLDTVVITGCANTSKAVSTINKISPTKINVSLSDMSMPGAYNTELTKLELGLGGRLGRPLYFLTGDNPTVVPIQKPDISNSDCGWRVENNVVVFRINVPADITHLQVALDDGVWHDFAVKAGASNDIVLTKRFIYNGWFYLRWKNNAVTGVITLYNKRFNTGVLVVEPYYRYRNFNRTNDPNRDWYSIFTFSAAGYASSATGPLADNDDSYYSLAFSPDTRAVYYRDRDSDYNSAWASKTYTLKQTPLFFQNDLSFKAETGLTNFTVVSNGNEQSLPWRPHATRPAADAPIVNVTLPNRPRALILDLKENPTTAIPNTVIAECTLDARKAKLFRVNDGQLIATAESVLKGQKLTFNIEEKMFNHLEYGVHYLNDAGDVLSPVPVKFFGVSLDKPDQITDYAYDSVNYIISFTTPARAKRASVKQFGIEIFSFECTQGGVTQFYMSKALNMSQRYELWLYNSNNETWDEPYVMVDVNETDEKPTSTGPYTFPEWTNPSLSDVVTYIDYDTRAFADIQRWVKFNFKVRINGIDTDQFIKRNSHGIITSIAFNAGLDQFVWDTGYSDTATTYNEPPTLDSGLTFKYISNSNGLIVIDVWHEWAKYSLIDEASFGKWAGGATFFPYYGQSTGRFQKTEISNGYIRNTYRLRYKPQNTPRVCPLYHLNIAGYSKAFRSANIYIHPTDMVGSQRLNSYYGINRFVPIIDGLEAKWEVTRNDDDLITKLRCFNSNLTSFTYDTALPDLGWTFDNYDPAIDGTDGAENIYHTLEFCLDKGYWDSNFMSYSSSSLYADQPPNATGEIYSYSYSNAIFAIVYPYALEPRFETSLGAKYSLLTSRENTPYSLNNDIYQFQDAFTGYTDYDVFKGQMDDSVAYINGELCVVTKETVTIPYTPTVTGNLENYYNDLTYVSSGPYAEPVLEPYTFVAYVLTTPNFTVSNRQHPNVWTLDKKPVNQVNPVKIVIGRKKFTEDWYITNSSLSSNNVYSYSGLWYAEKRRYWASLTMVLHIVPHKLLKLASDIPSSSDLVIDESKSMYNNKAILTILSSIVNQNVSYYPDSVIYEVPSDFNTPIDNFFIIDDESYTLKISDTYAEDLEGIMSPFQRTLSAPYARIYKTSDPDVYIEFNHLANEKYVGFTPGVHKLTINFDYDTDPVPGWFINSAGDIESYFNDFFKWNLGITKEDMGYVKLTSIAYITTDISPGFKLKTNGLPFTILDAEATEADFTPVWKSSYKTSAPYSKWVSLAAGINPYYLDDSDVSEKLTVLMDGIAPDIVGEDIQPNYAPPEDPDEDWLDRSDPTLLRSIYFIWTDARFGLIAYMYPYNTCILLYQDVGSYEEFEDPIEIYEGDRHVFELTALTSADDNKHHPFLCTYMAYTDCAYGIPSSNVTSPNDRIESVVNGDQVWTRLEVVIGRKPITEEDYDPEIGVSYFEGMSESELLRINPSSFADTETYPDIYYADQGALVPNYFQYPYTSFGVTVNGKPAEFVAAANIYSDDTSNIRLSQELTPPRMYSDLPGSHGLTMTRALYDDGSVEPLGNITEGYDISFIGPDPLEGEPEIPYPIIPEEQEPTSTNKVGIYVHKVYPSMLGGLLNVKTTPTIICDELELVLVFDVSRGEWIVYSGDGHPEYLIEFRYKHLYDPKDGKSPPIVASWDIQPMEVNTTYNTLHQDNVKLLPNAVNTEMFELSWITRVNDRITDDYAGFKYFGAPFPSGSTLEHHLPEETSLDETYRILPVYNVTMNDFAVTINGTPAILDLTNYTSDDRVYTPNQIYTVTINEEDNVYPTRGGRGSFTASNQHGTIHYDVNTAAWTALHTATSDAITIGLTSIVSPTENEANVNNLATYHSNGFVMVDYYQDEASWSLAFRLMGKPTVTVDPTEVAQAPNLASRYLDYTSSVGGELLIPNYELFDMNDFELVLNGNEVIVPTVTLDTHSVPTLYKWLLDEATGYALYLDVVEMAVYTDADDWPNVELNPEFGILPAAREVNLDENSSNKFFTKYIWCILQWNYKKLLDVTDTRPLFLDANNSSRLYVDDYDKGYQSSVIVQGTKKSVSAAFAIGDRTFVGNKSTQPFYGWMPTGYTGISFAIESSGFIVDSLPAAPINDNAVHSAEIYIWPPGGQPS